MNNLIRILYSLFIGLVAMGIAKLVHPGWGLSNLLIFGLVVFVITAILALLIKRAKK